LKKRIDYKKAGVDIDKANELVKRIAPLAAKTDVAGTIGRIGGFGSLFDGRFPGMKEPVLVSSTDGVGTKLRVAMEAGRFDTLGIDLVAMCANDVVTLGARPLFFLDYLATGKLDSSRAFSIISGIAKGCREAGCALIGGETAEMPGIYSKDDFDMAGFCVGVVERKKIIDGKRVVPGDRLIGIASSGIHSNGYSLVRKLFSGKEMKGRFAKRLLEPTRIYVKDLLRLGEKIDIKAAAHITGGGFYENLPRVLPRGTAVSVDKAGWRVPAIFRTIKKRAGLEDEQMYRTFNMGIGMVLFVDGKDVSEAIKCIKGSGARAYDIGEVIKWARREVII